MEGIPKTGFGPNVGPAFYYTWAETNNSLLFWYLYTHDYIPVPIYLLECPGMRTLLKKMPPDFLAPQILHPSRQQD